MSRSSRMRFSNKNQSSNPQINPEISQRNVLRPFIGGTNFDELDDSLPTTGFNSSISYHQEPKEETASRLKIEGANATVDRWVSVGLTIVFILGLVGIVIFCIFIILNPKSPIESVTQSWSVISLIMGGIMGYFTGKNSK